MTFLFELKWHEGVCLRHSLRHEGLSASNIGRRIGTTTSYSFLTSRNFTNVGLRDRKTHAHALFGLHFVGQVRLAPRKFQRVPRQCNCLQFESAVA